KTNAAANTTQKFLDGLALALSDDGKVGSNDAPGLRELAGSNKQLRSIVDQLESAYEPPQRRNRLAGSGYGARVESFNPGPGPGFTPNRLDVVLGRPEGAPSGAGSLHTVSLGAGGSITIELGRPVKRGLVVFENGIAKAGGGVLNPEPAKVEVSAD